MGPSSRPQWPDLLDPSFRKIYGEEIQQLPQKAFSIFNVANSTKNIEKDSSASGLSKLIVTGEGEPIQYEEPNQGYDVTYTHIKRKLGTQITQEMYDDDQSGAMQRRPRDLANAKIRTIEKVAADVFNYGFTAGGGGDASFNAGDTAALFSSAHTRSDGGSNISNVLTTDLNENSLEVALMTMRATVDDKGQFQSFMPDVLLVAPGLMKEAEILLNSSGRVGTANNDINPYEGKLRLEVWDYLGSAAGGSDTAWFVLDSRQHKLNWFWRKNDAVEGPDWNFDTETARWKIGFRASVGFSDFRGVFGSKGDNS